MRQRQQLKNSSLQGVEKKGLAWPKRFMGGKDVKENARKRKERGDESNYVSSVVSVIEGFEEKIISRRAEKARIVAAG